MKITLKTKYPLAYKSPDHIMPIGTRYDQSRNWRFNANLYRLFPENFLVKLMDLGCSGGTLVKDVIDDGHFAIGLEGSDWSKKFKRAAWAYIPDSLFTCDITKKFEVFQKKRVMFDVITAWEVMEHIKEDDLPKLLSNVKNHIRPSGLFIVSITSMPHIVNGVNLHQTIQSKKWWVNMFKKNGFTHLQKHHDYFDGQFVRGGRVEKLGEDKQFVLVLSPNPARAPKIPQKPLVEKLYDKYWHLSKAHKLLKILTM